MSGKTVAYQDYVAGWFDGSVHDLLAALPPRLPAAKYALLTCLDSNPRPASLGEKSPELRRLAGRARVVGTGLLLPTGWLREADAQGRIFFGFDEVWFFPADDIQPRPHAPGIVGPGRVSQEALDKLGGWMSRNACSLGLGDGEGVNFIVKARGLVRCLLAYSLDQPEPAVSPFETEAADSA